MEVADLVEEFYAALHVIAVVVAIVVAFLEKELSAVTATPVEEFDSGFVPIFRYGPISKWDKALSPPILLGMGLMIIALFAMALLYLSAFHSHDATSVPVMNTSTGSTVLFSIADLAKFFRACFSAWLIYFALVMGRLILRVFRGPSPPLPVL